MLLIPRKFLWLASFAGKQKLPGPEMADLLAYPGGGKESSASRSLTFPQSAFNYANGLLWALHRHGTDVPLPQTAPESGETNTKADDEFASK